MRHVRFIASTCLALVVASALSGCVVVPVPWGYGGYHHHDRR